MEGYFIYLVPNAITTKCLFFGINAFFPAFACILKKVVFRWIHEKYRRPTTEKNGLQSTRSMDAYNHL